MTQHGPRIIRGNALALDHGNPGVVEMLAYRSRTVSKDLTEFRALANLFHHLYGRLSIPKLPIPGIHSNGNSHPCAHGVNANVIAQIIESSNRVQISNAGHTAHRPDGLILQGTGDILPLFIHKFIGAMDDALGAAHMGRISAPFLDKLGHSLSADLLPTVQHALSSVVTGKGAHGIDRGHEAGGAELGHHFPAHMVLSYGLYNGLCCFLEGLRIGYGVGALPALIYNQGLKPLGSHNRTQAPSTCGAAGATIDVRRLYRSCGQPILTGRPDTEHRGFLSVGLKEFFHDLVSSHSFVPLSWNKACVSLLVNPEEPQFSFRRLPFDDYRSNPQTT